MLRPLLIFALLATAQARTSIDGGVSDARPETEPPQEVEVVLEAHEFRIDGYDAVRGVAALRYVSVLPATAQRRHTIRVRADGDRVLLPMSPEVLSQALEARMAGNLRLVLQGRRAEVEVPTRDPDEEEVTPTAVELRQDEADGEVVPMARRRLDEPLRPATPPLHTSVRLGPLRSDGPALERARTVRLEARAAVIECLQRTMGSGSGALHGSLSVELRTSLAGEPEPPRVVVDGLVSPPLSRCLLETLAARRTLWSALPANARVYLPYYFRAAQ